jgi:hypothetical protein
MQLLMILALTGILSGALSGFYLGGTDGMILGGTSGFVVGVAAWVIASVIARTHHEYRLNQYFTQEGEELD